MRIREVDVLIKNQQTDEIVFRQDEFEVPADWDDSAAIIAASKYATGGETSVLQIIDRVVDWITERGEEQGYFPIGEMDAFSFRYQLRDILINQRAAFNSPTWFNAGIVEDPQTAACFILPVEDTMEDILQHTVRAGRIFKQGSGVGLNVSKLRANGETLSNRGKSSGPLSFMKMWDSCAGSIKSGGRTRRSAVLICMDTDHPDIMDFIKCKKLEEDKAKLLMQHGTDPEEAYQTVAFQNANHSVRVTNEFMKAVEEDEDWPLVNRGDSVATYIPAKEIFQKMAEIAHETGDPGIQFHDRMNEDNPVPSMRDISSTNPCGELSAIDNSACNLASLNLMKYSTDIGYDWELFDADIQIMITAMDILVDSSSYPTSEIARTTHETRPLGLGYTNLGALLMTLGMPYGSPEACSYTSDITRRMTASAYRQSIRLAEKMGSFGAFEDNKQTNTRTAFKLTEEKEISRDIGIKGLRNSQLTLLAPTGTISILMGCDSTGIEPLFSLETLKTLSGGGTMTFTPKCVQKALAALRKKDIDSLSGAEKEIFKTANQISWKSHIDMVAAAGKYLNGSISKTANLPSDATVEDVEEAYMYAWKKGLKAVTIYRDGSKSLQPLTEIKEEDDELEEESSEPQWQPVRKKLPQTRQSLTHGFNISGFKGFIQPSVYEDGSVGELFLRMQKQGSTISGLMDSFAIVVSLALQYGVPLEAMADKMIQTKFDPQGFTDNEEIPMASSIMDYIFRWLKQQFGDEEDEAAPAALSSIPPEPASEIDASGPPCTECGSITLRNGTCYYCPTCGMTTGCA